MLPLLLACAAGLWLTAAPQVLGYGEPARSLHQIAGPLIAAIACVAWSEVVRSLRHVVRVLGFAVAAVSVVPPFAAPVPLLNGIVVGLVAAWLATRAPDSGATYGGGWRAVLGGTGANASHRER